MSHNPLDGDDKTHVQMENLQMRVKIFSMMSLYRKSGQFKKLQADGGPILEDQINQWLSQNKGVEIVRVEQSACGGSWAESLWMISVWYNEHESE